LPSKVESTAGMAQILHETIHDIRQPIAVVTALAEAALTEPALPAAAQHRLEQIIEQADRLSSMIRNCLPAQREKPYKPGKPRRDLADMVHIVDEAIEAGRLTWTGDITLAAPARPVWYVVDPVLLRRALSNVLDNAVRAAGPAGTVRVEVKRCDAAVMLAVEDDGPGFGKIPSGTGLGLAAAARHVIELGGRIEYSGGAHGGTRVSLWFP
jgi:signal transduction histidine kinase